MAENKTLDEATSADYDAAHRPFDFVVEQGKTALVCESESNHKDKLFQGLETLGYSVKEAVSAKDALEKMRFHVFDVVVIDAGSGTQELLRALELLDMSIRRRTFVVLIGDSVRTMDNLAAFQRSVNLVVNSGDLDGITAILKRGVQENRIFYHTYMESLRTTGRT